MIKKILLTLLLAAWPSAIALKAAPKPLGQAHAHNDYYHKRPLLDALSHGFCSVEADVFLKNGNLLGGHFSVGAWHGLRGLQPGRCRDGATSPTL